MTREALPVAVIGAGPVGLAAAAHLVARDETSVVLDAGATVGASIREWGHVRLFSPWRHVTDSVSTALLEADGWTAPPGDEFPTGDDLVDRYLLPLAAHPRIASNIRLNSRVLAVTRRGIDKLTTEGREASPFVLRVQHTDGSIEHIKARAVIDASGTWQTPNPVGADGLMAMGETCVGDRIAYGIPDVLGAERERYAGRRVLVVGSGHSAFNALLDLAELAKAEPETRITWAIRRAATTDDLYGGGAADALPARGALGQRLRDLVERGAIHLVTGFRIDALHDTPEGIVAHGASGALPPVDLIIAATGFRPDLLLAKELRLALDPVVESPVALAPLIDPNLHSCGTVPPHGFQELSHPEPGFYTAGMKSYGRAPTFLLLTGYEQVRSVVCALTGDDEGARNVMLTLPETGVCSGPTESAEPSCCGAETAFVDLSAIEEPTELGCCGGPAPAASGACCALDAEAKAAGKSGCGCGSQGSGVSELITMDVR